MIDCDSQCNLTTYILDDAEIIKCWDEDKENSVYRVLQKVVEGQETLGRDSLFC